MKKMKLIVYGEGPTDYGWRTTSGEWKAGPVIYLIRKCAKNLKVDLEIDYADKKNIDGSQRIKLGIRHTRNMSGKSLPALRFTMYALENGYTKGIFYCDTDKISDGKNTKESDCKKHFENLYNDVLKGLQCADSKIWVGIPMIALKMIECWLLADEEAYKYCFGSKPVKVHLPHKPELIWGEKSVINSDYPKNYIKRVLKQYGEESDRDNFINIAEATRINILLEKCPISFARFYDDFIRLARASF